VRVGGGVFLAGFQVARRYLILSGASGVYVWLVIFSASGTLQVGWNLDVAWWSVRYWKRLEGMGYVEGEA
jgi:hypothetical protein